MIFSIKQEYCTVERLRKAGHGGLLPTYTRLKRREHKWQGVVSGVAVSSRDGSSVEWNWAASEF